MTTIIVDAFFEPFLPETSTDLAEKTHAIFEEYQENIQRIGADIEACDSNWRGRDGVRFTLNIRDGASKEALKTTVNFISKIESTLGVNLKAKLNENRITIIELGSWFGSKITWLRYSILI